MKLISKFLCTALVGGSVFLNQAATASAQNRPRPTAAAEEQDSDARWRSADTAGPDASEQGRLLGQALERYRDIERRGGWKKISTDRPMGPPFSYDCSAIDALERRLMTEGYLRRLSTPPPLPPAPPPPRKRWGQREVPPPPAPAPQRCKYGPELTDAVRAFQSDRKVLGDGQIGELTKKELNRPVEEIIGILEHDVERWQHVFLPPAGSYLLVNIPFYELRAYQQGEQVMSMAVIVGQPATKTPLFHDELEYIIVNPDWGIPDKIAKNEYWPSARRDPKYLSRQGITATGSSLRQKPGPRNPLGRIKFVMPNEHDVYLHDTPEQRAFTAAVKALSHGCVRLSQPLDLADYLLRNEPEWNPARVRSAIKSGKTMQINLRRHMPVYIIYSTSRVNAEGRLELRPDVYGRNGKRARVEAVAVEDEAFKVGP